MLSTATTPLTKAVSRLVAKFPVARTKHHLFSLPKKELLVDQSNSVTMFSLTRWEMARSSTKKATMLLRSLK